MVTVALTRARWLQVHSKMVGSALEMWLSGEPVDADAIWTRLADIGLGLDYTAEDRAEILAALVSEGMIEVVDTAIPVGFWPSLRRRLVGSRLNPFRPKAT